MDKKDCERCKKSKPLSEFNLYSEDDDIIGLPNEHKSICRGCEKALLAKERKKNRLPDFLKFCIVPRIINLFSRQRKIKLRKLIIPIYSYIFIFTFTIFYLHTNEIIKNVGYLNLIKLLVLINTIDLFLFSSYFWFCWYGIFLNKFKKPDSYQYFHYKLYKNKLVNVSLNMISLVLFYFSFSLIFI